MNDDSFFSINRLVEFGMGLAVAQQMVNTMNSAMTNMHVPGAMNPIQTAPPQFYYAIIEGKQTGPFSEQELSRLIAEKKIVKETYIWKPGLPKWEIAEKLPEVLKLVALSPHHFKKINKIMKINFVQTIIAIAISLLIAYGLYSFHNSENKILLSIGSFVFIAITLVLTIGVNFQLQRTTTNIRIVSGIFFAVAFISNLIFTFISFSVPSYVITNGMLILGFILIAYSINKAKQ